MVHVLHLFTVKIDSHQIQPLKIFIVTCATTSHLVQLHIGVNSILFIIIYTDFLKKYFPPAATAANQGWSPRTPGSLSLTSSHQHPGRSPWTDFSYKIKECAHMIPVLYIFVTLMLTSQIFNGHVPHYKMSCWKKFKLNLWRLLIKQTKSYFIYTVQKLCTSKEKK